MKTESLILCLIFCAKKVVGCRWLVLPQNCPGSVTYVPKTNSDVVHPKSSLITFLMNNKMSGKFSSHVLEQLFAVSTLLSCLWKGSTKPLTQGWCDVVIIYLTIRFVNLLKSVNWNWDLRFVVIIGGQPKTIIHSCKML